MPPLTGAEALALRRVAIVAVLVVRGPATSAALANVIGMKPRDAGRLIDGTTLIVPELCEASDGALSLNDPRRIVRGLLGAAGALGLTRDDSDDDDRADGGQDDEDQEDDGW